jgi:hypothetical protein
MNWSQVKFYFGRLLNLAGYPAVVRACEYSGSSGVRVSVKVHELYTIISVGGTDVYFNRLSGSIDGTGFNPAANCKRDAIQLSERLDALCVDVPPPPVHKQSE